MSCKKPIENDYKQKGLALLRETEISVGLIKEGIGYLKKISAVNYFYYLPLLLLSQGFERFMKVIICIEEKTRTGNFPESKSTYFTGSKGHDLNYLLDVIKSRCFTEEYVSSIPALIDDFQLINDDHDIQTIFRRLTHFNIEGKYYYLNVVLDREPFTGGPEQAWQELEDRIISGGNPDRIITDDNGLEWSIIKITQHIVPLLESLARALGRLFTFTLGNLVEGTLFIPVSEFVSIMDKELGAKDY